jgi:hypothetical protein
VRHESEYRQANARTYPPPPAGGSLSRGQSAHRHDRGRGCRDDRRPPTAKFSASRMPAVDVNTVHPPAHSSTSDRSDPRLSRIPFRYLCSTKQFPGPGCRHSAKTPWKLSPVRAASCHLADFLCVVGQRRHRMSQVLHPLPMSPRPSIFTVARPGNGRVRPVASSAG